MVEVEKPPQEPAEEVKKPEEEPTAQHTEDNKSVEVDQPAEEVKKPEEPASVEAVSGVAVHIEKAEAMGQPSPVDAAEAAQHA